MGGGDAASSRSGKSSKGKKTAKERRKDGPQKSLFHLALDSVRYLAMLASSCVFVVHVVTLAIWGRESAWLQIAVRSYLAIFCFSLFLAEWNLSFVRRIASLHDNWMLRGFLYSFVGLVGMEQNIAIRVEEIASRTHGVLGPNYATLFATLFVSITTWVMIGVGILYAMLGLLCMQRRYKKLEKEHWKKVKEHNRKKKMDKESKKQREDQRNPEEKEQWYDGLE